MDLADSVSLEGTARRQPGSASRFQPHFSQFDYVLYIPHA